MEELKMGWKLGYKPAIRITKRKNLNLTVSEVKRLLISEGFVEYKPRHTFIGQGNSTFFENKKKGSLYLEETLAILKDSNMKMIGSIKLMNLLYGLTGDKAAKKIREIQNETADLQYKKKRYGNYNF